ncbi:MAG: PepSY-associated TM helix domain-containing protein [Caulobacteraceae bacterium]
MPAPTLNRLRRLWFNIHLWIGVGLFVLLVPLGLSGTALVWRPELDRMLHPERFAVTSQATTLAPSAYLAAAGGAFGPSAVPTRIVYASRPGAPVVVSGLRTDIPPGRKAMVNAWLDPASGKVLSVGSPMGGFIGLMHDLHGQMLIGGGKGRPVVGWLGVFMLVSSLTGLWLWWPRGALPGGVPLAAHAIFRDEPAPCGRVLDGDPAGHPVGDRDLDLLPPDRPPGLSAAGRGAARGRPARRRRRPAGHDAADRPSPPDRRPGRRPGRGPGAGRGAGLPGPAHGPARPVLAGRPPGARRRAAADPAGLRRHRRGARGARRLRRGRRSRRGGRDPLARAMPLDPRGRRLDRLEADRFPWPGSPPPCSASPG